MKPTTAISVTRSSADYIKDYDLHRAEGVLLRHLSSVHKVTVPDVSKTEAVQEAEGLAGRHGARHGQQPPR